MSAGPTSRLVPDLPPLLEGLGSLGVLRGPVEELFGGDLLRGLAPGAGPERRWGVDLQGEVVDNGLVVHPPPLEVDPDLLDRPVDGEVVRPEPFDALLELGLGEPDPGVGPG